MRNCPDSEKILTVDKLTKSSSKMDDSSAVKCMKFVYKRRIISLVFPVFCSLWLEQFCVVLISKSIFSRVFDKQPETHCFHVFAIRLFSTVSLLSNYIAMLRLKHNSSCIVIPTVRLHKCASMCHFKQINLMSMSFFLVYNLPTQFINRYLGWKKHFIMNAKLLKKQYAVGSQGWAR